MKVCKFGGGSLANADQIRKVGSIILADRNRRIVVVSAPGRSSPEDTKTTDLLIILASAVEAGHDGRLEISEIAERYGTIARDLGLQEDWTARVTADLNRRIADCARHPEQLLDTLKAAGEDNCARLVADWFSSQGVPCRYLSPAEAGLVLIRKNGRTLVVPEAWEQLGKLRRTDELIIFPGFFGVSAEGAVMTFSRGGSDITGSILAAAVHADVYENWTDVDSVFAASPTIITHPEPIHELTYQEMRELAYAGFSVLHEEAILPAWRAGIPIHIRNTDNPTARGTRLVERHQDLESIVTGIAGSKGFSLIHVSKFMMNQEVGFAMRVLQILADYEIPIEHIPSGIDSLSIVVRTAAFTADKEKEITHRLTEELGMEEVTVNRNLGIVMIVGEAMEQTVGVTARAASALSRAGINLELIIQGASEISVIFGVRDQLTHLAIKALYREFFG